jgi:hypothetical protein
MVTYYYVKSYFSIIIPDIEKIIPVAIFKMAATMLHKFNIVRFQRPELIPDIEKFLPVAIFKMEIFTAHFLCHVLAAILKMADISKILKPRIDPLMVTYYYVKSYFSIITIFKMVAIIPQKFNIVRYQNLICG